MAMRKPASEKPRNESFLGKEDDWDHPVTSHMRLSVAQAAKKGVLYLPRNDMQPLTKYLSQDRISQSQSRIGT